MAKRPEETAARLSAQLWAALGYLAKKRGKRELLAANATRIDVIIEGKVGRSKICEHVVGLLELGADGSRAAVEACDPAHLIALLLAEIPEAAKIKQSIAAAHAKTKILPAASDAQIADAKQFMQLLRSHSIKPVAGSITFEVSAETR